MVSITKPLIGDLVWLFYQDRFGIFKIISAIVDDYRYQGKIPLKIDTDATLSLDRIIDDMNTGKWPTIKDRDSTYRRCLGWSLRGATSSDTDIQTNHPFNEQFHKFIQLAVEYYNQKQIAVAIKGAADTTAPPSFATEAAIRDTLRLLRESFIPYEYGTNQLNTLSGIIAVHLSVDIIRKRRSDFGIPKDFELPQQYIAAAYDLLVLKRPINHATVNRYNLHKELSESANDILLQIPGVDIDTTSTATGGRTPLSLWLDIIEAKIETYRTAYKMLTGVDLGKVSIATAAQIAKISA